jgi:hypothetical protein
MLIMMLTSIEIVTLMPNETEDMIPNESPYKLLKNTSGYEHYFST